MRDKIPPWLKHLLIPGWNAAHQYGWLAYDYASAIAQGRFESCTVCGRFRPMLYRRRVIPQRLEELWGLTPKLAQALARKESCDCAHCGAKLRGRRLAHAVLSLYPTGSPPAPLPSLARWVEMPEIQKLRIAEINRIDGVHDQIRRLPQSELSDYVPGARPGSTDGAVRSEDLTRLTYASSSFDLVLTSETLEHVPDLAAALREIHRVLVPGGRHVFTIPLLPHVERTFPRAVLRPDGSVEQRATPICHPGGDAGYPVFTEFGGDLIEVLERAGFATETFFGPNCNDDIAQVYVSRKV
jgi:SAM-dependent methyltransferase